MRVLVTGAFGNVGRSAIEELLARGHQVRCFDLRTRRNVRAARTYGERIEVVWGDLRNPADVATALVDQEVVVHLAFIIPKMSATGIESEARPDWAREVNVGGTANLLQAAQDLPHPPGIIFSSSLHVYGQTQDQPPPRTVSDPVRPIEHYACHKVECEQMLRDSGLKWSILRFAAVLPLAINLDPGMFDVPLENRIEYVHTRDVGVAIANAIESEEIWRRIWHIGGGPRTQFVWREMVGRILEAIGVGLLPEGCFSTTPFCTDWLDTTESERVLQFQRRDLDDYIKDVKSLLGFRVPLIRLFRPFVRAWLSRQSPYLAQDKPKPAEEWKDRVAVVTGASGGIGSAVVEKLSHHGLRVVLVGRRREQLERLAAKLQSRGGEAHVVIADLTQESGRTAVYEQARAVWGKVDVLVNNAGFGWYGFGSDMPWTLAWDMLQVNVTAVVRLTLLFLRDMKSRGDGHIVNVSSIAGSLPSQGVALYGATKSFVDSFTTALHRELRGSGVRISVLRPGAVATAFFEKASGRIAALRMPARSLAVRPERVASRVWRLLSRPARVAHVPRLLALVPWVELIFGWLIDRIGPALLRRQAKQAPA
jgi:UDP-glucose 4-epimerase